MATETLESALNNFFESRMTKMNFCIPARIELVRNLEELRVDVKPLINAVFKDDTEMELPAILNVPVIMPCTSTTAITMPVNQGDTVLLVFSQRDLDGFKTQGNQPTTPSTLRYNHFTDAIAIIGLSSFSSSPNQASKRNLTHSTNDLAITHNIGTPNECEIRFSPDGSCKLTASKVDIETQQATVNAKESVEVHTNKATVTAPESDFNGNVLINGGLTVTGVMVGKGSMSIDGNIATKSNVSASGQVRDNKSSMDEMRNVYNEHTNPHNGSSPPPQQM